ncbi:type IX secretion system membrane protein PorP/SprF [Ekhidna sp.]|uniref:PorP/SprF family type IX secretion system membrane protein n=1 Tax=Ekhidna sp. TaxID=2608089 RepID=UPI0032ED899A
MNKVWCFILLIFGLSVSIHAQQQVMFTQYMFNGLVLNPAYAGSHESISLTALNRIQWVGIDGAPNTQTFSVHSPVPGKNIGLGAFFVRDNIGVTTQNNFFLSYAYRMQMSRGILSFGLQGGFSDTNVSYDDLGIGDSNLSGAESTFKPNFGAGIYYLTDRFYAGASVPYIMRNSSDDEGNSLQSDISTEQIQHYYITSGAVFDLSPLIKLKPSFLIKAVSGAPVEFDLNANVLFDDKLWLGVSYRSFDSIDLLLELQLNTQLRLGYAYDITTSDLRKVNSGSHEIMLNYRFVFAKSKIVTPRYF